MESSPQRFDGLAKILAGATAGMAALLTAFGVTTDRIWTILDDESSARWIVLSGVLAVLAIAASLAALLLPEGRERAKGVLLGLAGIFYVGALVGAVLVAADSANEGGRPFVVSVETERTAGGVYVRASIEAERLDRDQLVVTTITRGETEIYRSTRYAETDGELEHRASILVDPGAQSAPTILVKSFLAEQPNPRCDHPSVRGPSCATVTLPGP